MPFHGDVKSVRLKHVAGVASYRDGREVGLVITTRMLRRVRAADLAFLFGEGWAAGFLFPSILSIGEIQLLQWPSTESPSADETLY